MRRIALSVLTLSLVAAGATTVARAAERFVIDQAHTNIVFLVNHLGYSRMVGQFQDFEGSLTFDDANVANSALEITIKTASVDTGRITGDLTLLGTTKPVTLEVTFNKKAPHPLPQYNGVLVAGFSARTSLMRSEWGMKTFVPNLGDEIDIWLEVEAHQK